MALSIDIEKRLQAFTLRVQLETENGVLALLGASGCGKSMTLKCIAGIEKPDRGRIVLNGRVLFDSERHIDLPPQKRRVGYLFQQYALFPHMTVEQNIRTGLRSKENADRRVAEIIDAMGLRGTERQRPNRLSGGQQQRVALARILINEPEVLLLDEPFSALDAHLRFRLEQEVRRVIREFGKPVLLVSHDRDEVFRLSDRVAVMDAGNVETVGEKTAVFAAPRTRSAAMLTGCKNLSPLEKLGPRRIRALDWDMELDTAADVGDAAFVGIRMHSLRPGGTVNAFRCTVAEVLENPFSDTVLLRRADRPQAGTIGWETSRDGWDRNAGTVDISLPPEELLLLR